jgi:ATP-dependent helicase/DNAse subunit B
MSLEIYHIPPGAESRRNDLLMRAFESSKAPDYSSVYVISPTKHILEQRKRTIHKLLGKCYIPPEMMTLGQFATTYARKYSPDPLIPFEFTSHIISSLASVGTGYANLMAGFIRETNEQFPDSPSDQLTQTLESVFEKENIPEEIAARAFKCLEIKDLYAEALETAGLTDPTKVLLNASKSRELKQIPFLVLDGFYELGPSEYLLVKALINRSDRTLILVPISHKDDDLSYCYTDEIRKDFGVDPVMVNVETHESDRTYFPAKGLEEEAEAIARHIKSNYLNSKNRQLEDTWIVFPKLSPYKALISRVLERYGIPYSFSSGSPLSETPEYMDLLSMLDAMAGGFKRVPFSRFLHSPYFTNIPKELKDSVPSLTVSSANLNGIAAWRKAFSSKGFLKEFNTLNKSLEPLLNHSNSGSFTSLVKTLLDVLMRLGFHPSEDGITEVEAAISDVALLDSICKGPATLQEFTEAVRLALGSKRQASKDQGVKIAELFEVRGLEPEVIYIGGMKDGDIPSKPDMDYILPDRVRHSLGLVDTERFIHLQSRIFKRLTSSAKHLYLSYPSMEGDKMFLPSVFLADLKEQDTSVKGIYSEEELQTFSANKHFRQDEISKITARSGSLRVTDIDNYRNCPRKFFIEKIMRLSPPEISEYEVEAMELGTIVHKVMEKLITGPVPGLSEFKALAEKTLDEVLANSQLDSYLSSLIRESFLLMAEDLHELEEGLKDEGYEPMKNEMEVKEEIDGIRLKGKIDRIDKKHDGSLSLIDYKTGATNISAVSALRGENLQLFLYALMLEAKGRIAERVGIYSIKDLKIKWVPNKTDIKKGNDLKVITDAARGYLKETAGDISEGNFLATPQSDQSCRNCIERPYCPYINGTTELHKGVN